MNCQEFEFDIALYVEGDLTALQSQQIESHLAICESCRAFASDLQTSQLALKTFAGGDVEDAVLDQVRHKVMTQIRLLEPVKPSFWERLAMSWGWRFALASVLVALVVLPLALAVFQPKPENTVRVNGLIDNPPDEMPAPASTPVVGDSRLVPPTVAKTTVPKTTRRVHRPQSQPAVSQKDINVAANTGPIQSLPANSGFTEDSIRPSDEDKMRVEIQTEDPNVRIIWFVDKGSSGE